MKKTNNKVKKPFWTRDRYLQILALLFVIALSIFLVLNRHRVAELKMYGYIGVWGLHFLPP
jgi:hypothetical protein